MLKHSTRLTATGVVSLPVQGLTLVAIEVYGGATPGSLSTVYDGIAVAHFPSPLNGYDKFDVAWGPLGSTTPTFTFNGGLSSAVLHFADAGQGGKPISAFRAIRFARTAAGAEADFSVTVTYDQGQSSPKGITAYCSASTSRWKWPQTGALQWVTESEAMTYRTPVLAAPTLKAAPNLTLLSTSGAANTNQAIVYY